MGTSPNTDYSGTTFKELSYGDWFTTDDPMLVDNPPIGIKVDIDSNTAVTIEEGLIFEFSGDAKVYRIDSVHIDL